jgi:hypothetical protein
VPTYFTNESMYHDFMSGAGYILPWWALPCLYQQSLLLPYFFIEDVFLTGWIGKTFEYFAKFNVIVSDNTSGPRS